MSWFSSNAARDTCKLKCPSCTCEFSSGEDPENQVPRKIEPCGCVVCTRCGELVFLIALPLTRLPWALSFAARMTRLPYPWLLICLRQLTRPESAHRQACAWLLGGCSINALLAATDLSSKPPYICPLHSQKLRMLEAHGTFPKAHNVVTAILFLDKLRRKSAVKAFPRSPVSNTVTFWLSVMWW